MKLKQLTLVLATLAFLSPTVVNAREVDVRAGDVSIQTNESGDIYVDTNGTSIYVPEHKSSVSTYPRRRFYYWRRYTHCSGSSIYSQQSTHTGRGTVRQTTVVTRCR